MSNLLAVYRQFLELADEFRTIDALDITEDAKEQAIYFLGLAAHMSAIGFRVPPHTAGLFNARQNVQDFRRWLDTQESSIRPIVEALANRSTTQENLMDSGDGIIVEM